MKKKILLITGGCSGIGYEISNYFLNKGNSVLSIDIEDNSNLKKLYKKNYHYFKYDLNKYRNIPDFYNVINEKYSNIDVLINNARSPQKKTFLTESYNSWSSNFNVNLNSHFFLSREFLIKSKDFKKRRYLINISSISGKLITSQSPSYNITKAALLHMSNYLATLGKEYNCNINAILPGLIIQKRHFKKFNSLTNESFKKKAISSLNVNNVGTEIDICNTINFLISGKADFINGEHLTIDGGSSIKEQLDILLNF